MSECDRRAILSLMNTDYGATCKSHAGAGHLEVDLARSLIIMCHALFIDFIIVVIRIDPVWILIWYVSHLGGDLRILRQGHNLCVLWS